MIEIKNLTKIFKLTKKMKKELKTKDSEKIAVNNINLNIKEGEIFGILGTNGAGKTTTLRIISTLLKPTSGTVEVNGLDTVKKRGKGKGKDWIFNIRNKTRSKLHTRLSL